MNVRPATATGYLFELTTVHGEREPFGFGFSAGSLYAHVSNSGYRRVQLPDGFFSASDVDVQVRALTEILRGLRAAPRDPSRTDALEEDLFLAGFGALRPAIEALFERAREAGWTLRIGSAEAPMRMPKSTAIVVYPSASYARPGVRIWCASVMLRDRVAAVVGAAFPMDEVVAKGDAVKLFPGEQTRVSDLIPLLEALAVEM